MTHFMRALLAGLLGTMVTAAPAQARQATSIVIVTASNDWIQVGELQAFAGGTNVALQSNGGIASGNGSYSGQSTPDKANDGSTDGNYPNIYHAAYIGGAFLRIDFAQKADVTKIVLYGRTDSYSNRNYLSYTLYDGGTAVGTGILDARDGPATADLPTDEGSWSIGDWSEWSSTCSADATRTRTVTCMQGPNAAADDQCLAPKPTTSEDGEQVAGCTYAAQTTPSSAWSTCVADVQSRPVTATCRRSDGVTVGNAFCPGASVTTETRTCISASTGPANGGGSATDSVVMRIPLDFEPH